MKGVVWIPEDEHEQRVQGYLDDAHQHPYLSIGAIALGVVCLVILSLIFAYILGR